MIKTIIGWREWLELPQLCTVPIKAKVDTGAKTSCLHAFHIDPFEQDGALWVTVGIHPHQHSLEEFYFKTPVIDQRIVRDSGGHEENRYVIRTDATMGSFCWPIELTLTNRDEMRFRMLLGRNALKGQFLVDSAASYLQGTKS